MRLPADMTVLIVEDERGHARLMEIILRNDGVENEIIVIHNGTEAMEFLFAEGRHEGGGAKRPLVVFLDLNLPGTDGHDILQRLKSTDTTLDIPVVVITSSADPDEKVRCEGLGCDAFLVKPPGPRAFAETFVALGIAASD